MTASRVPAATWTWTREPPSPRKASSDTRCSPFTSGEANVFKNGELIRTLGPGDVFGEIAVFFGGVRTVTVVATTPMQRVMIFNSELARLDREVRDVADKLRATVADLLGVA